MRTRARWLYLVIALAVAAVSLTPVTATADPVSTFYVQVYANPTVYGEQPVFSYNPLYQGLPPGTSLIGHASCSQVYDAGVYGPTESTYGTGGKPLDAGNYHFVSTSCATDPAFPLQLDGITGQYNLVLSGGTYSVEKAPAVVAGVTIEGSIENGAPTPTVLSAVVVDAASESNQQLEGATVAFDIQLNNQVWDLNVCSAVTTDNGQGDYLASCTLSAQDALTLYQSTGVWEARFAGTANFGGYTFGGQAKGLTTSEQAAKNNAAIGGEVHIIAVQVPPECDNPDANTDGSILVVSIGELSCSQLQVLQITTGVVFGVALAVGGGFETACEIAEEIAGNAATKAFNEAWPQVIHTKIPLPDPSYYTI